MRPTLSIEIWSDVVCPWCYIGKRRFEAAVAQMRDELEVSVVYRPFQLDPSAPIGSTVPVVEAYAAKFGGLEQAEAIIERVSRQAEADGLDFQLHRARRANTFDAHRLLWFAEPTGRQPQVKERLLKAYFTDGLDIGDRDVLAQCAGDAGLDQAEAAAFLAGRHGVTEVRHDIDEARELGISAVPTFVIEGKWAVPGAQDPETFVQVLRKLAAKLQQVGAGNPVADV